MALACTSRSTDDAKQPSSPAKPSPAAEPAMPTHTSGSGAEPKPTLPNTQADQQPERREITVLDRAREVLVERQAQRSDEVGNSDSLRHVPGSYCPDTPGQVGVDGPTLHYTFDIRVPEPDTDPDDLPPRLSPPFGPGEPFDIECIFAVADAVYTEVEGADELRVTMNEAGRLIAEIRFSRALYESLDAMRFLYEFGYEYHEFYDGGGGTKRRLWKMWNGFIAKIPAERRRDGGGFEWRPAGR